LDLLTGNADVVSEFSCPHSAADRHASGLRQTQSVGQIRHDGGDNRDLGTATQIDFCRHDSSAIDPNERIWMVSQQLKLVPSKGPRTVCLVLSKDRNHAVFGFRRSTGMDEPLNESEYGDVTSNSQRNRQQQNK
jgi:hypothetical protein